VLRHHLESRRREAGVRVDHVRVGHEQAVVLKGGLVTLLALQRRVPTVGLVLRVRLDCAAVTAVLSEDLAAWQLALRWRRRRCRRWWCHALRHEAPRRIRWIRVHGDPATTLALASGLVHPTEATVVAEVCWHATPLRWWCRLRRRARRCVEAPRIIVRIVPDWAPTTASREACSFSTSSAVCAVSIPYR
jgi:hypothetical protein